MTKEHVEEPLTPDYSGSQHYSQGPWSTGTVQEPNSPASTGWDVHSTSGNASEEISYHDNVDVEEITSQDPGYDGDVEVVKPYAIEEPDEPTTPETTQPETLRLQSLADYTQDDLVNSLRNLDCHSDSNDSHPRKAAKRGRKRKPGPLETYTYYPYQTVSPSAFSVAHDNKSDGSILSPKRLRRRSKWSNEEMNTTSIATSSPVSSDSRPCTPTTFSTTENGMRSERDVDPDDKMDVD